MLRRRRALSSAALLRCAWALASAEAWGGGGVWRRLQAAGGKGFEVGAAFFFEGAALFWWFYRETRGKQPFWEEVQLRFF